MYFLRSVRSPRWSIVLISSASTTGRRTSSTNLFEASRNAGESLRTPQCVSVTIAIFIYGTYILNEAACQ